MPRTSNPTRFPIALLLVLAGLGAAAAAGAATFSNVTAPPLDLFNINEGIAWGDYNDDTALDLYVVELAGTSGLFRNVGANTFLDETVPPLNVTGVPSAVAWADYDNDGDEDLLVAVNGGGPTRVFENLNEGAFADAILPPVSSVLGAAWIDYDGDGLLDIYLSTTVGNTLLHNDGGSFSDATAPPLNDGGNGRGVAAVDYDDDGDTDLFLINFLSPARLFANDGSGTFTDVTAVAFAGNEPQTGFASAWGDYDNDGDLDVFVGSDTAGNRLYQNNGGTFIDVTPPLLQDLGLNTFEASWVDYDNDGGLDLYVVNAETGNNHLFRNTGGGTFVDDTTPPLGNLLGVGSYAAAWADYDGDGLLDVYLTNDGPNALLHNEDPSGNQWLHVTLEGTASNRSGIGARVRATTASGTFTRQVTDGGHRSQDSRAVEFGLGTDALVTTLEIRWPSGTVDVLTGVAAGQNLTVVEGSAPAALAVSYVTPNTVRNDGPATIRIYGNQVDIGPPSTLLLAGVLDTLASINASTVGSGWLDAEFSFDGVPTGSYDLLLSNSAGNAFLEAAVVVHSETLDLTRITTLTSTERFPDFRGDGGSIAFSSNRYDGATIFIKDPAAPDGPDAAELLTFAGLEEDPSWSPDGNSIVYEVQGSPPGLAIVDVATMAVTPQPIGFSAARPSWSPLGDLIAFDDANALYTVIPNTDIVNQVTFPPDGTDHFSPSWSPDGTRLVFVVNDTGLPGSGLATAPVDGSEPPTVIYPEDEAVVLNPAWSPDGKWIAFASDAAGDFNLYVMRSSGGDAIQLTTDPANEAEPTWSPDGTALAFVSTRGAGEDIYLATEFPTSIDTDGDLVPDFVDACPTEAPALGEIDRDFDGCPDSTSSFRQVRFWEDAQFPLAYETDAVGDPSISDDSEFLAIADAFNAWTSVSGVTLDGADDGLRGGPSVVAAGDGRNSISFTDPAGFNFNTIGMTITTVAEEDTVIDGTWYRPGQTVDADIVVNTRDYTFGTPSSPGPSGSFDIRTLFTHELGHLFGFAHSFTRGSTMFYVVFRDTGQQTLELDDVTLARRGYADTPASLSVEGTFLRTLTGQPVVGAAVMALSASTGDSIAATITGIDGTYRFFELTEDVRIYVAPLDGGPAVNGLRADGVNPELASVAEIDFLPEYYDQGQEGGADPDLGTIVSVASFPFLGADIYTNLDLDAPQVVFTNPPDLGIDFPVTGAISIKFDEGIEKTSITNASFALTNTRTSIDVAGNAGVLQLDSLLVFTPSAALEDSTVYSLRIGPGIEDKFGNAMPASVVVTFTTADPETLTLVSASPVEVPEGGSLVLSGTGFSAVPTDQSVVFRDGVLPDVVAVPTGSTPNQLSLTVPFGAPSGEVFVTRGPNTSNAIPLTVLSPRTLPTGAFLGQTTLGGDPIELALSPSGDHAYVATGAGVSVVGAFPGSVEFLSVDEIPIPGGAAGVVTLADGLRALAISSSPPQLHVIDADPSSTLFPSIVQSVSLAESPLGIAVIPGGSQVLIVYANRVVAHDVNPGPGFGLETRQWGVGGAAFLGDVAVSADRGEAYATRSGGRVAVLGLAPGEDVLGMFPAGTSPSEVAGVPAADSFLGVDFSGTYRTYGKRGPVLNTDPSPGGGFKGLTVSPEGYFAYGANFILNRVDVFDLTMRARVSGFATGVDPTDVATGSAGRYIYVCTDGANQLEVYDSETGVLVSHVAPRGGGDGTRVTVVGSGFDPVAANNLVSFGGDFVPAATANAAGTVLTVVQPSDATGSVIVRSGGEDSNTVPYKVVDRTSQGAFLAIGTVQDVDISFLRRIAQSPDGKWVFGIRDDGSMVAIQGDPVPTNFLRKVQDMSSAQTGLGLAGEMIVTPDGAKLYALDESTGQVAVFDITLDPTAPLRRLGSVEDSTGTPVVLSGDGLAVLPDGSRLLVRSESNNTIWEVDIASDVLLAAGVGDAIHDFQAFPFSMAVDPRGTIVYAADNDAVSPVVLGFDLDPGSPTYRQQVLSVPLSVAGTIGPDELVVSPDGTRLTCIVGQPLAISIQYNGVGVDIDPASGTYLQVVAQAALSGDDVPVLRYNHTGAVLYVKDQGLLSAVDPATLSLFGNGPVSARMAGSADMLVSLDDARLYVEDGGGGLYVSDLSDPKAFAFASGNTQTGVAGQPLPAPIVVQGSTTDPTKLEGGVYVVSSPNGNFGFPDQLLYRAADADGEVSIAYTAGPAAGEDTVSVRAAGGSTATAFLTILADTSLVPPEVLSVLPGPTAPAGVNTTVAVDFSKAINPATVSTSSYILRPAGGGALAGRFTYANGQRRVVFKSATALQYGTTYEVELTSGLQDYSANPLGTGAGVYSFTTQAAPALALNAVNPSAAGIGSPIVLSGTGFGATTAENQVLFGSIPVVPTAADPGALTAIVPAGASSGNIQVVTSTATSNTFPFTVLAPTSTPVNEVVNQIAVPSSGQQIAVLPNGTRAYMTSSGANTVVPINLATELAEASIGVGNHPFGIAVSPTSDRVFVTNFYSNTVSVIDAVPSHTTTFHTVIATIPTGPNPAGVAVHPDGRTLYVVCYGNDSVDFIDTDSTSASYNSARSNVNYSSTSGTVTVTPDGATVIIGTDTGILLVDPTDGSARSNVNLSSSPGSVTVTPDGAFAVVVTQDNVLWLVDVQPGTPEGDRARSNVNLSSTPGSVTVSPDGAFIYVTTADDRVLVFEIIELGGGAASESAVNDLYQLQLVASIEVDENPIGLAFDVNTRTLLVVNSGSNTISFINASEIPSGPVTALVDLDPNTLNLGSKGKYISGYLQFPVYIDPMEIDLSTVLLDSTVAADTTQLAFTDKNEDGILEAAVKFPRDEAIALFSEGGEVVLHVTGIVDGREFAGQDTITTKAPKLKNPKAGSVLPPGQVATIEWSPSPAGPADHLDIYWISGAEAEWDTVVVGTADDSTEAWSVPDVEAGDCSLMLVAYDSKGEVVGITYMNGTFTISAAQVGVEDNLPLKLALLPALPNPFRSQTEIRFELPEATPVTIRVFGIDGSLVRSLVVGEDFPPGRHGIVWDGRNEIGQRTGSGVYFLRMETPRQALVQKVVRIQR